MNEDNDINHHPLPSGLPFKTDKDYFDDFSSRLSGRIADLEEIKAMAPVLSTIPKYNPFEVPAGYFKELPSRVSERAVNTRPNTPLSEWLLMLVRPRFVIPVAATLFFAIAGIRYMNRTTEIIPVQIEELSLEEHLYDIDESTIIEKLTADASSDIESTEETGIEDYLLENNIDETNLEL